jgi:hypothetical protein
MAEETFSERLGYFQPPHEILFREEAPDNLRQQVLSLAFKYCFSASKLRDIICELLTTFPDRNNWSELNF